MTKNMYCQNPEWLHRTTPMLVALSFLALPLQYYKRGFQPYVLDQNCHHDVQCVMGLFPLVSEAHSVREGVIDRGVVGSDNEGDREDMRHVELWNQGDRRGGEFPELYAYLEKHGGKMCCLE